VIEKEDEKKGKKKGISLVQKGTLRILIREGTRPSTTCKGWDRHGSGREKGDHSDGAHSSGAIPPLDQ